MLERAMKRSFGPGWKPATLALALSVAAPGSAATVPAPARTPLRTPLRAPDSEQARAKLAALRARIDALTNERAAELAQQDALGARLRQAELAITAKRRSLDALRVAVAAAERRRSLSIADQARTRAQLDSGRAALAAQVLAAYMAGRQEGIKLLLSQSDAAALGRLITYYGYFGRERAAQIDAIRARQQQLQQML